MAGEQTGGLAESPLQVGVADLLAGRALLLAGRLVAATHEPRVRQKLADVREALDVVDFVEQDQRENLADAWDRTQTLIGIAVVDLGVAFEVELDFAELAIVGDRKS